MTPREEYEAERARLAALTLSEAAAELSNAVYAAAHFLERREGVGRISGNGQHAAQGIATPAVEELRKRWQDPPLRRGV